jgi:hypothetical protein
MKNILIICLICCFGQHINAQVQYSNVNGFEMIEDGKKRKKMLKSWKRVVKNDKAKGFDFVGESKSLIFLTMSATSLGDELRAYDKRLTRMEIFHHEAKYANIDYMSNEGLGTYYAFDKNSLELKFVNKLNYKAFSMSNPETISSYIDYENDHLHLFYRKREKGKIRYYHKLNDSPEKALEDLDYILKKKTSINPPFPSFVASFSGEHFLVGFTENSKSYANYIYTKELELVKKVELELPVVAIKKPRGLLDLGVYASSAGAFKLFYNDQENTIGFIGFNREDENNQHFKIFEYDVKREKMHKHNISLNELGYKEQTKKGLLSKTTFHPLIRFHFQNGKLHIIGANPIEGQGEYERLATEIIYHQFDKNYNVAKSDKMSVPDSIWGKLGEDKKMFKPKKSEYDFKMISDGDKLYPVLKLKSEVPVKGGGDRGGVSSVWTYGVGTIIFKIENDKLHSPLIFTGLLERRDDFNYFHAGGQIYKATSGEFFKLYSINDDKESLVASKKSNISINETLIYGNSKFILFPSKDGFIKVDLK